MFEDSGDVIYIDVIVSNIDSTDSPTIGNTLAEYNESRTIPYLYSPSDYYGAVVQFNIENTSTPILYTEIVPNQGNPNLTIYNVALSYGGSTAVEPVIFICQNATGITPPPPSAFPNGTQDTDTSYYSVYSYSYFTQLVNTAFANALTALKVLQPAIPAGTTPPIIKFDPTTLLFSVIAENTLYNQGNANHINVSLNGSLYYLYYSFSASRVILSNSVYLTLFIDANTGIVDTGANTITVLQERNSTNLWPQISSLVITSQSIPVLRSQTFSPALYYSDKLVRSNNNSQTQAILLEYSVDDTNYTKNIVYNPTAQYKLFALNTEVPLYNLDLKFFYRTTTGVLRPIALTSGASLSVKLGFFKKSKFTHLKSM